MKHTLALILLFIATASASADAPPVAPKTAVEMSGAEALVLAERLLLAGQLDKAAEILGALAGADPENVDMVQAAFLAAQILERRGDVERASRGYAAILAARPDLTRVRLELARTLFLLERDAAAAYHFRLVLADRPPQAVRDNIQRFLDQIRKRKLWTVEANLSLAPDSNVNAGPKDDTVELLGFPLRLDENAREKSGLGVSTALSVSVAPRLSRRWRLETRMTGRLTDYGGSRFDDIFAALEAGPRYEGQRISASLLATGSKRWFGGDTFNTSYGGRLAVQTGFTSRIVGVLRLSLSDVSYDTEVFRDGPVYSISTDVIYALGKRSLIRLGFLVSREQADDKPYRNNQYRLFGGYRRELPAGFTVELSPEATYRPFEAPLPAFSSSGLDLTRKDWSYGASVSVTKRDWSVYGFAPIVTYSFIRTESNIDFFSFDRHRGQVGLTRVF
ncbi:MAG: porin family protein [Pseudomonadota bacterium]